MTRRIWPATVLSVDRSTIPHKARIGSISSGTLRNSDLLETFSAELEYHVQRNVDCLNPEDVIKLRQMVKHAGDYADRIAEDEFDDSEDEFTEAVTELGEALELFSPDYVQFSANEGDGACFGYWPCMNAIEELPTVEDGDAAKALGEDCKSVNDHGNVTVFNGNGEIIIAFV